MSGKNQELSTRAVELACLFFENRGSDVTPGGMLEVAALIEGFLTGRFRVEYRSDFEPIKDGADVFSLFSHVRAVVIDPAGDGEESEGQRIDKIIEENTKFRQELDNAKILYNQIYDELGSSQEREKEAKRKLALAMKAGQLAARTALICAPMLIICVISLVFVLYFK